MSEKIHPTAIISPQAHLDPSVEVGPYCVIGPHVKISQGSRLMSHVVVEGWTEIGKYNTIYPFCVLGAVPQDLKYGGEETYLRIGDNNTIRESVTMNLGTSQGGGETVVGNDNLIMAYTHLGHDCRIGNQVVLSNSAGLAGHVTVEDHAILGGMVGVTQYIRIGTYAYVVGKTALEKDIPPYCIGYGGRPCRIRGANIVGLKRQGIPTDTIQKINEAVKLWMRKEVPRDQAVLEIESQYGELDEIRRFIGFVKESRTGCAR